MKRVLLVLSLLMGMAFGQISNKKIADQLLEFEIIKECNKDYTECKNKDHTAFFSFAENSVKFVSVALYYNERVEKTLANFCHGIVNSKLDLPMSAKNEVLEQAKKAKDTGSYVKKHYRNGDKEVILSYSANKMRPDDDAYLVKCEARIDMRYEE